MLSRLCLCFKTGQILVSKGRINNDNDTSRETFWLVLSSLAIVSQFCENVYDWKYWEYLFKTMSALKRET